MFRSCLVPVLCLGAIFSCGDDDHGGSQAQQRGVGAECTMANQCFPNETLPDGAMALECLTTFRGGYCGLQNCAGDEECPLGSACITHDDGENYCFLICSDKPQCNVYRTLENESNCSSNTDFVDGAQGRKTCVPPSSGI